MGSIVPFPTGQNISSKKQENGSWLGAWERLGVLAHELVPCPGVFQGAFEAHHGIFSQGRYKAPQKEALCNSSSFYLPASHLNP